MAIVTACGLTGLCGNLRLSNDAFLLHFVSGTDNGWNVLPLYRLFSTSFIRHTEAKGVEGWGWWGQWREEREGRKRESLEMFDQFCIKYCKHVLLSLTHSGLGIYILYTSGGDESLASIFLSRLLEIF